MRSPVFGPNERTIEDTLSQKFWNFVSLEVQLTFKGCWRGISTSRCCIGGGHRVCKFQPTFDGVNACIVPLGRFGGVAGFSVLELGVQEGSSQTALTEDIPCSVAESLLHVGDVVV